MAATSFHSDIRAGLRQRLSLVSGLPTVDWEGRSFTPTVGTAWISETYRPVQSVVTATGIGGTIAHTVVLSLKLYYPTNAGTTSIESMAGSLLEQFRPGTAVTYGSSSAVVQRAERQALDQEADWLSCLVSITLIGHTSN